LNVFKKTLLKISEIIFYKPYRKDVKFRRNEKRLATLHFSCILSGFQLWSRRMLAEMEDASGGKYS
jgi:hypothetical protein